MPRSPSRCGACKIPHVSKRNGLYEWCETTLGWQSDSLSLWREHLYHFIVKYAGHFWEGSGDLYSNLLELYVFFLLILRSIVCSIMIYVCAIHTWTLEKQHSRKLNIWMYCTKTGCVSTKQQQYWVGGNWRYKTNLLTNIDFRSRLIMWILSINTHFDAQRNFITT